MTDNNQELTELKAKATELGIEYSGNIGIETLQKRIDDYDAAGGVKEPAAYRIKVLWKNVHTGTGVKLLRGTVLEVSAAIYNSLKYGCRTNIDGDEVDAIKLVDNKVALTHKIGMTYRKLGDETIETPILLEVD